MNAHISFDPQAFRNALGSFTTGVTIITCRGDNGEAIGITANSFNSVSLNPPMVLWSLAKNARSLPAFSQSKHWNVHVLSAEQEELSGRFARQGEDKFSGLELDTGLSDAPLLKDCTARFQCRTAFQYEGGDHVIFVGEVLNFDHSNLAPLAFHSGKYALTASKPRGELRLSESTPLECSYTEDMFGYLLGRAHYQQLHALHRLLNRQQLSQNAFYVLSVLCIRDGLTVDELNSFISYTGHIVTEEAMQALEAQGMVARDKKGANTIWVLTALGRETSLEEIALAKSLDQDITDKLGSSDAKTFKVLLKRLISCTDPGLPDMWGPRG
ncbi:flavin reductase [Pseudomonas sp. TTU2014-080ASC]|uniref:flavin reductase n=1 Tax=Pseudomonas sp. TTU2014-080ASC TaxID=1729724 RepID=UPI00071841B2|nr:flavin reductase [Pseudomonas sp. TTU2014-080ASC]KRW58440.1 peptidase [Pseudomonas sp. TTU2014-080ASC]